MTKQITVLLPVFNSEKSVRNTLESIKWADEILVVDSFSTDSTLKIANEFGAKIIQHEYENSAAQKNWALQYCRHEWILQIDSDEILEEGAELEIRNSIKNLGNEVQCFKFARKNHVLGKWIQNGGIYPDWEYRLFKRDFGKWLDIEVHSRLTVPGKVMALKSHILHFGMHNISKQISNLNRYTRYEADELIKKNKKFSLIRWILFPLLIFIHRFIWLGGYKDGWRGYLLAVNTAYYYFLSYSKFKEIKVLNLSESPR